MLRVILATSRLDIRDSILKAIATDKQIEIVATAFNGAEAVEKTKELRPDLVLLGVSLQTLDSLEATKEIMIEAPTPIVLVFSVPDPRAVELSVRALEAGALAVTPAPPQKSGSADGAAVRKFLSTLRAMSQVKVVRRWRDRPNLKTGSKRLPTGNKSSPRIVGIAASTGGPAAVQSILAKLPRDFPAPILIVQHIASGFIEGVASWLDAAIALKVKVAEDGELLAPHVVYLAPDGHHLGVASRSRIVVADDPPINGFRPSGTYLFASMARVFGSEAVGIILTGMGNDGADGLRAVYEVDGTVLAQDETSSVVFGMPKAAIDAGIAHRVLPLDEIARTMISLVMNGC
ncbi:MAG: response regulator [Mesorhizobium sp.]|uniref:chemotaxis protein CheB n=1 Tax=Mesorhizobium sp. TaxID=1871066 RepID=UPI0012072987|nr:chemotaxis protein CheB [Mesorhizobium sp.]TIS55694.1 MAG: response regulator [Mesorhizobium sp.]TIS86802.1 MAG: response regulator [Mesorhizobium sp.]TJW04587.1 MAG: response regulator [Mesorhizobium sp.]TJW47923.1 MAG: response regulator [Mesorhizobium sp.]